MTFGVVIYSFAIGNLSSVLSKMDSRATKLQSKLITLALFGKQANLPKKLMQKLRNQIL
jgi:hypothetical protein